MLAHRQVAGEHISEATEDLLSAKEIQVFGPSDEAVAGMIAELTQAGVPIRVKPVHLDGFTRGSAG